MLHYELSRNPSFLSNIAHFNDSDSVWVLTRICLLFSDVNFIASPPSMIAAGSVAAAVQGLYLKSSDSCLSSQNLTNFLSQVIRSDPVSVLLSVYHSMSLSVVIVANLPTSLQKDCLRSCQEQIESLLESSLRQAQQHNISTETKRVEEDVDLSCTPTDVRDINIWTDRYSSCVRWISSSFCWVWALAKGFMGQMENGLPPAPHHPTNTSTTCPSAHPNCWPLSGIPCGFDDWAIAGQDPQWRTGNEWKSQSCPLAPLYVLSQKYNKRKMV